MPIVEPQGHCESSWGGGVFHSAGFGKKNRQQNQKWKLSNILPCVNSLYAVIFNLNLLDNTYVETLVSLVLYFATFSQSLIYEGEYCCILWTALSGTNTFKQMSLRWNPPRLNCFWLITDTSAHLTSALIYFRNLIRWIHGFLDQGHWNTDNKKHCCSTLSPMQIFLYRPPNSL